MRVQTSVRQSLMRSSISTRQAFRIFRDWGFGKVGPDHCHVTADIAIRARVVIHGRDPLGCAIAQQDRPDCTGHER
jgi:hypothetical protein